MTTDTVLTPGFHEDWYSAAQQEALARLARQTVERRIPGAFVEVGCWEGRSTIAIANAIWPAQLRCVDHWLGDLDDPRKGGVTQELAASRPVYQQFIVNMDAHTRGNYAVYRMDWQSFIALSSAPKLFAFVHIDGSHDRTSVRKNLEAFLPHMSPGAVFCGDDWLQHDVRHGVLDVFPAHQVHTGQQVGCPQFWWTTLE